MQEVIDLESVNNMMKLHFCISSLILAIVIVGINQTVNAQSDNFKNYTNKDMMFSIQHPSKWTPEYSNFRPEANVSVVYFDNFQVATEEVEPYLDTDTMTLKNTSLEQRVQKELNEHASSDKEKVIRHNWMTVGGNPAYKIEYTWSCEKCRFSDPLFGAPDSYSFEIFTLANGKFYRLSYSDEPLKVPETLTLANKMVDSFQVNTGHEDLSNKANEDMSNNSALENYQNEDCPPMQLVACTPDGGPRCPNGYHRSPDGDCERARD